MGRLSGVGTCNLKGPSQKGGRRGRVRGDVTMEAEVGVMLLLTLMIKEKRPRAEECRRLQELEKARKQARPPGAPRRNTALQTHFRLLTSYSTSCNEQDTAAQ